MLRAQSETVTSYPKNATLSTTGCENDFACHFLGASVREARRWAHGAVRLGSIDDSGGRPGRADYCLLGQSHSTGPLVWEIKGMQAVPFSWDEPTTNHKVPVVWETHKRHAEPETEEHILEEEPWREFGMGQGTQQETVHRLTAAPLRPCRVLLTHKFKRTQKRRS